MTYKHAPKRSAHAQRSANRYRAGRLQGRKTDNYLRERCCIPPETIVEDPVELVEGQVNCLLLLLEEVDLDDQILEGLLEPICDFADGLG